MGIFAIFGLQILWHFFTSICVSGSPTIKMAETQPSPLTPERGDPSSSFTGILYSTNGNPITTAVDRSKYYLFAYALDERNPQFLCFQFQDTDGDPFTSLQRVYIDGKRAADSSVETLIGYHTGFLSSRPVFNSNQVGIHLLEPKKNLHMTSKGQKFRSNYMSLARNTFVAQGGLGVLNEELYNGDMLQLTVTRENGAVLSFGKEYLVLNKVVSYHRPE